MSTNVTPQAFTISEICDRNKTGKTKIYEEIREGRLRARKIGSKTIITHDDEQAWRDALPVLKLGEPQQAEPETAPAAV